jgi:DNA-binding transcriptional ArsR family regulator
MCGHQGNVPLAPRRHFAHDQTMNVVHDVEGEVARIAAVLGEPARSRMLYSLMSGRASTATELALVAGVSPSTATTHLHRLRSEQLVRVVAQGKHRYYSLEDQRVADLLESFTVFAGMTRAEFVPRTPEPLRAARTCYDHLAGALAISLHDRLFHFAWLAESASGQKGEYTITDEGATALAALGIDVAATRRLRRRLAFACLDWSERRPHLAGAVGAAFLNVLLHKRWVAQHLTSRALRVTALGRRELASRFQLQID